MTKQERKRRKKGLTGPVPPSHQKPQPGQLYEWDGNGDRFIILAVETRPHIWMCQAIDLQKGRETRVGIRRRDRYNGWYQVLLEEHPF